ncbi:MAG TPA: hypothetical protein VGE52_08525, partial [Pirellulales bacterium]
KYAELAATSRRSGDEGESSMAGGLASIGKMAAGVGAVKFAWDQLAGSYQKQEQLIDNLGKKAVDVQRKVAGALLATGDIGSAKAISAQLGKLPALKADATGVFSAVSMVAPHLALADRIATVRESIGLAAAGNVDNASRVAGVAANFVGVNGKSTNDAADLATALTEMAGEDVGILSDDNFKLGASLLGKTAGISLEGALAFGLEAKKADLSPKIVPAMAAQIADQTLKHRKGDRAYNRFVDASAYERFEMLRSGGEEAVAVMGQADANKLGQINMEDVNRTASALADAQATNLANRRASDLLTQTPDAVRDYQAQVAAERYGEGLAQRGMEESQRATGLENYMTKNNYTSLGKAFARGDVWFAQQAAHVAEAVGFGRQSQENVLEAAGFDSAKVRDDIQNQQLDVLRRMLNAIESQQSQQFPSVVASPE